MSYDVKFKKIALKDISKLKHIKLDHKLKELLDIIKEYPYQTPPPYKKLRGELEDYYSRRINYNHRLVYIINSDTRIITVVQVWTHYNRI